MHERTIHAPRLSVRVKQFGRKALFALQRAPGRGRRLPDFLLIGAQRSGTTSLFNALATHPQVSASVPKEVHYFDLNYERGLDWYMRHFPEYPWKSYGPRHKWGEASPYYLFHPLVPARVKETAPDAKLIVMLRNPIDRAYSDYQFQHKLGYIELTFEQALAAERELAAEEEARLREHPQYVSPAHRRLACVSRGMYALQLARWYDQFSRDQVLVLPAERFFLDMEAALASVLEFLDLPPHRFRGLKSLNTIRYSPMKPETRGRLRDVFRDDRRRLEQLTGISFDWDI